MNNEHIQRILKGMADSLEGSTDFVLAQAPEVIQQLIMLKRIEYSIFLCLSVVILALLTWGAHQSIRKLREAHDNNDDVIILWFIAAFCTVFSAGACILVTFECISDTLTVWFAPKVFILEYAAHLLKYPHG